jgi:hypothetical protein
MPKWEKENDRYLGAEGVCVKHIQHPDEILAKQTSENR